MKRSILTIAAAAMLTTSFFSACKKDDDNAPARSQLIIGTWTTNAYGTDDNRNGVLETSEYETIPAGAAMTQTYRSDGTGVIITQSPGGTQVSTNMTWALTDGDQNLRVVAGASTSNATISRLTEHEFMGYDPVSSTRVIYLLTK